MVEAEGGYFKIYDNVIICPANAAGINNGIHMGTGQSQSDKHIFYNNTVIKKKYAPGNAISYNDGNKPAGQGNGTLYCVNNIAYAGLGGKDQGSTSNNLKIGQISNASSNFGNIGIPLPRDRMDRVLHRDLPISTGTILISTPGPHEGGDSQGQQGDLPRGPQPTRP
jgi:hypothetical protein